MKIWNISHLMPKGSSRDYLSTCQNIDSSLRKTGSKLHCILRLFHTNRPSLLFSFCPLLVSCKCQGLKVLTAHPVLSTCPSLVFPPMNLLHVRSDFNIFLSDNTKTQSSKFPLNFVFLSDRPFLNYFSKNPLFLLSQIQPISFQRSICLYRVTKTFLDVQGFM